MQWGPAFVDRKPEQMSRADRDVTPYNGRMDISRRQLAVVVLASTAAAQAPPAPKPEPGGDVDAARLRQRATAQIIARIPLAMTVEPAFLFKA